MIEQLLQNLPWILAALLGVSEALAHIPQLESNSILQMVTKVLRKAKDFMGKAQEALPPKEDKKEDAE